MVLMQGAHTWSSDPWRRRNDPISMTVDIPVFQEEEGTKKKKKVVVAAAAAVVVEEEVAVVSRE